MSRNPLQHRIRTVTWTSAVGGSLATVALVAGIAHTASAGATTGSDSSTTSTSTSSSTGAATGSSQTSGSGSRLDVPSQQQPAVGGSNGS